MSEHKHAEVLRAIADGASVGEFEFSVGNGLWATIEAERQGIHLLTSDAWEIRRKQKTHVVNGFTVPEPLRTSPDDCSIYFVECPSLDEFTTPTTWSNDTQDLLFMQRGIAHATAEGAIANCKARLGIDPAKDES